MSKSLQTAEDRIALRKLRGFLYERFGALAQVRRWFLMPNRFLADFTPKEMIDRFGEAEVWRTIEVHLRHARVLPDLDKRPELGLPSSVFDGVQKVEFTYTHDGRIKNFTADAVIQFDD